MVETFSSPEERAFARQMVADIRAQNVAALKPRFDPSTWPGFAEKLPVIYRFYPVRPGTTELINYSTNYTSNNGSSETTREYLLVTHDAGHWTTTRLRTYSSGGPHLIVAWHVNGSRDMPPEYATMQRWEAAMPWIRWGGIGFVIFVIGLIVFLVRLTRRNRAARLRPGDPIQ